MAEPWLLADLGGTNTRVGLGHQGGLIPGSTRSYANAGFDGLAPLLQAYLSQTKTPKVSALCAGVAGPVRGQSAQLTNHDWRVESTALRDATGAGDVHLLNDLQAQGYALDHLDTNTVTRLIPGAIPDRNAIRLVMGLGTGCNVAVVHSTPVGLLVPPAESGHTRLPHCDGTLGALVAHLGQTHAHLPIESALSGPGLQNIYRWIATANLTPDQIVAASANGDAKAQRAVDLFTRLLGTVAGDLALSHLPMGGLYLIGGLARAIAPYLAGSGFRAAFIAKGPYAAIMQDIPIYLINDDTAALRGCARYLTQTQSRS